MNFVTLLTKTRVTRIEADLSKIAGEPVEFEYRENNDYWYAFTGELGHYRLADKYEVEKVNRGFSCGLNKWYIQVGLDEMFAN